MKPITQTLNRIAYARQRRLKLQRNTPAKRSGTPSKRGTGRAVAAIEDQT